MIDDKLKIRRNEQDVAIFGSNAQLIRFEADQLQNIPVVTAVATVL